MHHMIDIETLSSETSAVVLSLAVVPFDLRANDTHETLTNSLVIIFDLNKQVERGRTISPDTVKWWMQQNNIAKQVFSARPTHFDNLIALTHLNSYLANTEGLWGNGSMFDNVIVRSLLATYELKPSWSYRRDYDYRTLRYLATDADYSHIPRGVEHDPLFDAIYQVLCAQHAMRVIRDSKT